MLCHIHREIFGETFPETAGRFRTGEANYGRRAAAQPEHIDPLMQQLELAIRTDLQRALDLPFASDEQLEHIFLSAAQHHATMVHIHPFVDGNGRWARFVTNVYLNDTGLGCGTIVYARDRRRYIAGIDRALDTNEPGDLANLFFEGYIDQAERRFTGNRPRTE